MALTLVVLWPDDKPPLRDSHTVSLGAVVAARSEPRPIQLSDGSKVNLHERAKMRVHRTTKELVKVGLEAGKATFDVVKAPKRRFEVIARDVRVSVIGTRFSVAIERQGVNVSVFEGTVQVERADGTVERLSRGATWSSKARPPIAPPETKPEIEPEVSPPKSAPPPPPPPKRVRRVSVQKPPAQSSAQPPSVTAKQWFERAHQARRGGEYRKAAEAFQSLLRDAPHDSRASLAAFELGRLRMDRLEDFPGAIEALELALRRGGPFSEDALARLVRLYDRQGPAERCRVLKARYLQRYTEGVHLASVQAACR